MRSFAQYPFALSLSKGQPEHSEGTSLRSVEGFDRLSPNGKMIVAGGHVHA